MGNNISDASRSIFQAQFLRFFFFDEFRLLRVFKNTLEQDAKLFTKTQRFETIVIFAILVSAVTVRIVSIPRYDI